MHTCICWFRREAGPLKHHNVMGSRMELVRACCRAIVELLKEVGMQMLTGSVNLTNVSMPVKMFEARSYLQKLTWVYPECAQLLLPPL